MKRLFVAFIFGAATLTAPLMASENDETTEVRRPGPTVQVQCYAAAYRGFQPLMRHAGISRRLHGGPGQFNRARSQALNDAMRNCQQMHFRQPMVTCTALPETCRKVR